VNQVDLHGKNTGIYSNPSNHDLIWLFWMCVEYPMFQGICITLVPLRMASLEFDETTVGLIQALPGVTVIFLGPPFAQMSNTRWRGWTLSFVFFLSGVASILFGFAESIIGFIIPQLLTGISTCAFYGNMLAASFQLRDVGGQSSIQGKITAFQGLGVFAGPLIGGGLLKYGPVWAFAPGIFCALIGVFSALKLSHGIDRGTHLSLSRYLLQSYRQFYEILTKKPIIQLGMLLVAMTSFFLYVTGGTFYLLYANTIGVSAMLATLLMSGRELLASLLRLFYGIANRYVGSLSMLIGSVILGSITLSFMPLAKTYPELILISIALGISGAFVPPALNLLIGASAKPEDQAFAILCLGIGHFFVQTLTAPVVGSMIFNFGYSTSYPVIGLFWTVAAVIVFIFGKRVLAEDSK
jgi:MFS family permease